MRIDVAQRYGAPDLNECASQDLMLSASDPLVKEGRTHCVE